MKKVIIVTDIAILIGAIFLIYGVHQHFSAGISENKIDYID